MVLRSRTNPVRDGVPDPVQERSNGAEPLQALVHKMVQQARLPSLCIAVTRGSGPVYLDAFGAADLATSVPATTSTRYLWFSMTKLVTATAALRLADHGIVDLDAPVAGHLPDLPIPPGRNPTTRQLLTHTAGLANPLPVRWVHPADQPMPDQHELVHRLLTRNAFARKPGGKAHYSNLGYLLVAELITRLTGQPFPEYLEAAVLAPLGMTSTNFSATIPDMSAVGHLNSPRPLLPAIRALLPPGLAEHGPRGVPSLRPFLVDGAGYGGLVGPVTDAARFLRMHLNDGQLHGVQILSRDTARNMRRIVSRGHRFHHATGWFRKPTGTDTYVEHYGTGAGFWNVMRIYPEQDLGIVILTNSTRSYPFHRLMTAISATL
jgi:CubicO group peptidase (beta-lactamase class C family)